MKIMEVYSIKSHLIKETNNKFKNQSSISFAQSAIDLTDRIIQIHPSRLAGTDQCKQSAYIFNGEFSNVCDSSVVEEFDFHPSAFLSFMKLIPVLYSISLIFLAISGVFNLIASILMIFTLTFTISQFVFYFRIFDWMHPKKTGHNIISEINPKIGNEIKQQIIISGHHDSPYIFNFLESKYQRFYALRIISGITAMIICTVFSVLKLIGIKGVMMNIISIYLITSLLVVLPLFFFLNKKGSPGAGDNLIASAILVQIAKYFSSMKENNQSLENTRIIFASFDAEESGLRGSRAYNAKHKANLHAIPTISINIDSVFNYENLQVSTSDINGLLKCSNSLATDCKTIANDLGYELDYFPMKFGGGGTDAAEFTRNHIDSVTLIAFPTEFVREGLVYHTSEDTVDKIELKAVGAIIDIVMEYIKQKDRIIF